jgi:hypothetical protein
MLFERLAAELDDHGLVFGHRVEWTARIDYFDKARALFGESGFAELSALLGYYTLIDIIITAMAIVPAPDAPGCPREAGRRLRRRPRGR